jgi:hypothetical protein
MLFTLKKPYQVDLEDFVSLIKKEGLDHFRDELFGRKHTDWLYENEVRVIQSNDRKADNKVNINLSDIAGICFCMEATDAFKRVVTNICRSKSIPVYECVKKAGLYGFEAVLVDERKYLNINN